MTKKVFIDEVRAKLKGLSEDEISKALEFYEEAIDDRMEEGLAEDQAVAAIGTPEEVANQILMDMPLSKVVKAKSKPDSSYKAWEIVLIILGFPIWFPLLLTAAILALTLMLVVAILVITFFIVVAAIGIAGLAVTFACIPLLFTGGSSSLLLQFGLGLICVGLAVVMFIPAKAFCLWSIEMCGNFGRWVKQKVISGRKKEK